VRSRLAQARFGLGRVGRAGHAVAGIAQIGCQQLADRRVVVDHQNVSFHGSSPLELKCGPS